MEQTIEMLVKAYNEISKLTVTATDSNIVALTEAKKNILKSIESLTTANQEE